MFVIGKRIRLWNNSPCAWRFNYTVICLLEIAFWSTVSSKTRSNILKVVHLEARSTRHTWTNHTSELSLAAHRTLLQSTVFPKWILLDSVNSANHGKIWNQYGTRAHSLPGLLPVSQYHTLPVVVREIPFHYFFWVGTTSRTTSGKVSNFRHRVSLGGVPLLNFVWFRSI